MWPTPNASDNRGQREHERPSDTTKDRKGQASGTDNGSQGQTGQGHTEPGVGGMADGLSARLDGHFGFEVEPDIPRVATGIPERVNRLKALATHRTSDRQKHWTGYLEERGG